MGELKNRRSRKKKQKLLIATLISLLILLGVVIGVIVFKSVNTTDGDKSNSQQNSSVGTESINGTETTEDLQNTESLGVVGDEDDSEDTAEPKVEDFTMFFTGDVMLQYCRGVYAEKGINGLITPYLQQEMVNANMTVINNEFPFSTRGTKAPDKQYTFRVEPSYVSALVDMGVDVASLANNHALDFGQDALLDTFTTLDNAGIPYVGAGETKERAEEAIFVEAGGRKVGVLSASRVIPVVEWNITTRQPGLFCTYDSSRLVQRIKEIESQCDYVVVFVHWGIERKAYPEEYQRNLAKQYIDAGADLVVGNHSHVPQGIEYYKGVPIVYCLGNYIFNPNMTDTYALKAVWDVEGNTSLQVIPVDTRNYLTGELTGNEAQAFYDYLEGISFDVSIDENGYVTSDKVE
ncbi:MAG: CapA family protein [Agathobacter sp.]|nr:CapA family protein [Agathobacter sp.]